MCGADIHGGVMDGRLELKQETSEDEVKCKDES